ncbi:MAG: GspE/PulE family protein [Patiriisocius sp.]|uniref:GspE/PulE family protein n=1 Tax=Patiriisocius sp. TaxID=2822396 RepID=UPI003EF21618
MKTETLIEVDKDALQLVNADIAFHYGIVPKCIQENVLTVYIDEELSHPSFFEELSLVLDKKISFVRTSKNSIERAFSTYYRASGNNTEKGKEFLLENDFLKELIWDAKSIGSSDIHFEIFKDTARVRFRIDGHLIERYVIDKEDFPELVNKIKIEANLNISEKRLPQDGRINYEDFDIRVSILPTLHGEKIVMRILGKDTSNLSIEALGMKADQEEIYLKAIHASRGIILISGPTGSGKTTTLYATLKLLNEIKTNILTIEDPIEYTLKGINQVQLREDIGLTFTSALKTFLRQDPDIIMLGEIRDEKTAQMAIRASLTGHLVLSTIHTNSAIGTISRLLDMGVPSFLIAETLKISVAQRLVRKLCKKCKIKSDKVEVRFQKFGNISTHYQANGCNNCFHTGYSGRTAIYEMIPITEAIVDQIKQGRMDKFGEKDFQTLAAQALLLVQQGKTTFEEVYPILIEQ